VRIGPESTAARELAVLGRPILPAVQLPRMRINCAVKLTSPHCKPRHSLIRSPVLAASRRSTFSGSRNLDQIAKASVGVMIIASYSLTIRHRTPVNGLCSSPLGRSPSRQPGKAFHSISTSLSQPGWYRVQSLREERDRQFRTHPMHSATPELVKTALPFYSIVGLTKGTLCLMRKCPIAR
jgi:hypothetical protein